MNDSLLFKVSRLVAIYDCHLIRWYISAVIFTTEKSFDAIIIFWLFHDPVYI